MRKVLYILLALTFVAVESAAQSPNANEILSKVAASYAGCSSYYDEATIETNIRGLRKGSFRTTFVRPGHLAFELWLGEPEKERKNAWIVWQHGDSVDSWMPQTVQAVFEWRNVSLDTALLRAAVPSSGGSLTITPLLVPNLFRASDLISLTTGAKVTGEDKIDGRRTFRIEGTLWGGQQIKFWIDKTDYLMLKVERKADSGGGQVESTIRFKPQINTQIPPELLVFSPPPAEPRNSPTRMITSSNGERPTLSDGRRKFGASLSLSGNARSSNQAAATDEDEVIRVDTDLVVSAVLVMDKEGKLVNDLTKDDFIVKEDDAAQEVASFSLGDSKDVPRSIVLIIDYSGSQLPYIRTSVDAAKKLVDQLNPKDRMAVVTDDVSLLVDFTSDKELLKARLESLKVSALSGAIGQSEQYDALMAAVSELFSREDVRPIVIFQTDGDQLDSLKGGRLSSPFLLPRKYGLEDIVTATEKARASVYSVISGVRFVGVDAVELSGRARADWQNRERATNELVRLRTGETDGHKAVESSREFLEEHARQWLRRQYAVASLAKLTGAWTEYLERPEQADEIYNRILTDIDRRYVIGYYPTNRARDGKRRKVHIEVRNHPDYQVWGQKTYFAREER